MESRSLPLVRSFLAALLTFLPPLAADSAEPSPFDPLPADAEGWQRIELAFQQTAGSPRLFRRDNTLIVSRGEIQAVNLSSGELDPNVRSQFDPETTWVTLDGNGPVFWTRPAIGEGNQPYSARDWFTGAVIGPVQDSLEPHVQQYFSRLLDDHGLVVVSPLELVVADTDGGNIRRTALPERVDQYSITVAANQKWIVASLRYSSNSQWETFVWNRLSLEMVGSDSVHLTMLSLHDDLAAAESGGEVRLLSLPDLDPLARLPKLNVNGQRLHELFLGDRGLWTRESGSQQLQHTLSLFDLRDPERPALKRTVRTPGIPGSFHMSMDALAFTGFNNELFLWTGDPEEPSLEFQAFNSPKEGEPAEVWLNIATLVDQPVSLRLETADGSARAGEDYTSVNQEIIIPAGETEARVTIPTLEDAVLEAPESLAFQISDVVGAVPTSVRATAMIPGNGFNLDIAPSLFRRSDRRWTYLSGYASGKLFGSSLKWPQQGFQTDSTIMTLEGGEVDHLLPEGEYLGGGYTFTHGGIVAVGNSGRVSSIDIETGIWTARDTTIPGYLIGLIDRNHVLVEGSGSGNFGHLFKVRLVDGQVVAQTELLEGETLRPNLHGFLEAHPPTTLSTEALFLVSSRRISGPFSSVHDFVRELDPLTLETRRTWQWESLSEGYSGPGRVIGQSEDILVCFNGNETTGFDTTSGMVIWRLPNSIQANQVTGSVSGDILLLSGWAQPESYDAYSKIHFVDVRTGCMLGSMSMEAIFSDASNRATHPRRFFPDEQGWVMTTGSLACRIKHSDLRPNFTVHIPNLADNEEPTVSIIARERFAGSYETHWYEFTEDYQRSGRDDALITPYSQRLDISHPGQTLEIGSLRSVNEATGAYVALTTPPSGYSSYTYLPYPRKLHGTDAFIIHPHLRSFTPWTQLATTAPTRNSGAYALAVSDRFLAVGYPSEQDYTEAGVTWNSKVDIYDVEARQFLHTISSSDLTAATGLGTSLAFSRGRLIAGAPGSATANMADGKVFVFDPTDGQLLQRITTPFGAKAFGTSIAANDEWIAIGAPATYSTHGGLGDTITASRQNSSLHVYDASNLRKKFSKSRRGEMLGHSVALFGDRVAAGSPLLTSSLQAVTQAGAVRIYDLPGGQESSGILPAAPVEKGHFGWKLAGNQNGLSIGPVHVGELDFTGHALLAEGSEIVLAQGMPGTDESTPVLSRIRDVTITGGRAIRLHHSSGLRPYVSLTNKGSANVTPVSDGRHLYTADNTVWFTDFPYPPIDDTNSDGTIDELDWLLAGNPAARIPEAADMDFVLDNPQRRSLIPDPVGIDRGWDLAVLESHDLSHWKRLSTWSPQSEVWIDSEGQELPKSPEGKTLHELPDTAPSCFLKFQLLPKN